MRPSWNSASGRAVHLSGLRLLTYNVHGCVGADRRACPERIADVIASHSPDVAVLQELDVGRIRSGHAHQPELIAARLGMNMHFSAARSWGRSQYGNAILTREPLRIVREATLPSWRWRLPLERRGAVWASVPWRGASLQLIATHLGLLPSERLAQCATLLGDEWLGHPDCVGPRVVCGDLNAMPGSRVHRRLATILADVQLALHGHRAKATFPSALPLWRIDHVFVSHDVKVTAVHVPRTQIERRASDHLPLVVELGVSARG